MNTERPENDDAAREPGTTGSEGTTDGRARAEAERAPAGAGSAGAATHDEVPADEVPAGKASPREVPAAAESVEPEPAGADTAAPETAGTDSAGAVGAGRAPAEEAAVELTKGAAAAPQDAPGGEDARAGSADEPPAVASAAAPGEGDAHRAPEPPAGAGSVPVAAAGRADGSSHESADEPVVAHAAHGGSSGAPRRRSPVLIASVAAAVLLVGGGGAYLTSSGALGGSGGGSEAGSPSGGGTPAALTLDDYSRGTGASGSGGTSGTSGIAPGEPNPYGVTYKAAGPLPAGPGSAPVYWARGEVAEKDVAALAEALGVQGKPVADGEAWKVGAGNDGSGPVLRVNRQAPGMWTFTRYAPGADGCTGGAPTCPSQSPTPGGAAPVSEAAAKKAAAPVLEALGPENAEVDASQVMGARRVVNAEPVIGGLPSYGWSTGIGVSAQGEIVGGNGQLEAPVKGAAYPLLSAREALDALNAAPGGGHRMGIGGCASPVPLKDRLESPCKASTNPSRQTATVEHAALGLAPHTSGGRQVLVPSWLFEVKAAGAEAAYTVAQPAVEPAYLKPAATPAPTPTPGGTSGTSGKRTVRVDGYTVEGRELTVAFTGGVCADYKATAVETAGEVKVTVTQTPWPDKVCIMIAKEYHQVVQLDEAPGSRKVVGSDGRAVPLEKAGARLPQAR
ncbi:hypothetical protein [Streptomyces hilarionis]|uniref:hypothetical protein n=1 Tax=Streptomyces hilarionis TaxID=2839954 RepID=UPI00211A6B94|nr:hypothetical protein [Streptomyces hilarionis]MCQ9134291.1 hypothetical protein [Streptomyces hilarionis]